MQESFSKSGIYDLNGFNEIFSFISLFLKQKGLVLNYDYAYRESFSGFLSFLEKIKSINNKEFFSYWKEHFPELSKSEKANIKNLISPNNIKYLQDLFSPTKNGFVMANKYTAIPFTDQKEVWTDSQCVLIKHGDSHNEQLIYSHLFNDLDNNDLQTI